MRITSGRLLGSMLASAMLCPLCTVAASHADMDAVHQWLKNNRVTAPISEAHYHQRKVRMLMLDEAAAALPSNAWNAYRATWKHYDSQWQLHQQQTAAKQNYESSNPILHYLRRIEIDTLEEIQNTAVTEGVLVWNMYNMGVIVKTPTKTFGIDVKQTDPDAFADVLDFLIVSHSHNDHFDRTIAQAVKLGGKNVYGPKPVGVATIKIASGAFDESGQNGWTWDDVFEHDEGDIHLRFVISFQGVGYSNPPYGNREPNVIVRVTCGDAGNFTIMHSGDSQQADHAETARNGAPVDLYVCHAGLNIKWPMHKVQAALTVLSHANELGHSTRRTYERICADRLEAADAQTYYPRARTTVAAWGERIDPFGLRLGHRSPQHELPRRERQLGRHDWSRMFVGEPGGGLFNLESFTLDPQRNRIQP